MDHRIWLQGLCDSLLPFYNWYGEAVLIRDDFKLAREIEGIDSWHETTEYGVQSLLDVIPQDVKDCMDRGHLRAIAEDTPRARRLATREVRNLAKSRAGEWIGQIAQLQKDVEFFLAFVQQDRSQFDSFFSRSRGRELLMHAIELQIHSAWWESHLNSNHNQATICINMLLEANDFLDVHLRQLHDAQLMVEADLKMYGESKERGNQDQSLHEKPSFRRPYLHFRGAKVKLRMRCSDKPGTWAVDIVEEFERYAWPDSIDVKGGADNVRKVTRNLSKKANEIGLAFEFCGKGIVGWSPAESAAETIP